MPLAVCPALVAAHDPDALEPEPLVASDRPLVGDGRVDRDPVVAASLEEPAGQRADGVGSEALAVSRSRQEEVDVRVPIVGLELLADLREPDQSALELDCEHERLLVRARQLQQIRLRNPEPPARHLRFVRDLREPWHVDGLEWAERHALALQAQVAHRG